jgi:hypothetical protein
MDGCAGCAGSHSGLERPFRRGIPPHRRQSGHFLPVIPLHFRPANAFHTLECRMDGTGMALNGVKWHFVGPICHLIARKHPFFGLTGPFSGLESAFIRLENAFLAL